MLRAAALVLALLVALPVALLGCSAQSVPSAETSDSPVDEATSTEAAAEPPESTPPGLGPPIDGLAVADVKLMGEDLEWEGILLVEEEPYESQGFYTETGLAEVIGGLIGITYGATGPGDVYIVEFVASGDTPEDARRIAEGLLPHNASLPHEGAEPEAAQAWVSENLELAMAGEMGETTIGGVSYRLEGTEYDSVLYIAAPGF